MKSATLTSDVLCFHCAESATAEMVNVPKTRRTFCKKCGKYQCHKMTQTSRARIDILKAAREKRNDIQGTL